MAFSEYMNFNEFNANIIVSLYKNILLQYYDCILLGFEIERAGQKWIYEPPHTLKFAIDFLQQPANIHCVVILLKVKLFQEATFFIIVFTYLK